MKKAPGWRLLYLFSGERGIRTPGGFTLNSFQDCRNRPLCHLSGGKDNKEDEISNQIIPFCYPYPMCQFDREGDAHEWIKQYL